MGIRLRDFRCDGCGKAHRDYPYSGRCPETIECDGCGGTASWCSQRQRAQIHLTLSGRKYGEFDPQFGCVVEDYAHKKRLLKQMGAEELPPEKLEDIRNEAPPDSGERDPSLIAGDSLEEVMAQIPRDRVSRKDTGDLDQRMRRWSEDFDDANDNDLDWR